MVLGSALTWYQKKIGSYDKQLWEKTVEQRILRGLNAIPKKTAKIKSELIDVDLIRGSTFPKAKPQQGWIVATYSGAFRVVLFPLYWSWWKQQTCFLIAVVLLVLYGMETLSLCLYFSLDETFTNVPMSEVVTPAVLMLVLGIVHAQVAATFSNKTGHKTIARTKRKRIKRKSRLRSTSGEYESKSSPETASEDRLDFRDSAILRRRSRQRLLATDAFVQDRIFSNSQQMESKRERSSQCNFKNTYAENNTETNCSPCKIDSWPSNKEPSSGHAIQRDGKNSDEESGLDSMDLMPASDEQQNDHGVFSHKLVSSPTHCSYTNRGGESDPNCLHTQSGKCMDCQRQLDIWWESADAHMTKNTRQDLTLPECQLGKCQVTVENDCPSSEDEYFIAKHSRISPERRCDNNISKDSKNNLGLLSHIGSSDIKSFKCPLLSCKDNRFKIRRYSDFDCWKKIKSSNYEEFEEWQRRFSDNILTCQSVRSHPSSCCKLFESSLLQPGTCSGHHCASTNHGTIAQNLMGNCKVPSTLHPTANYSRHHYSSCESEAETPVKSQASDSEWPLISNTDCDSNSTDSSLDDSQEAEENLAQEDPFAWENQEAPTPLIPGGHVGSDKVSCTIWERNECKKVDLGVLDISSTIIRKVDCMTLSSEYFTISLMFACLVSILPLLFRLQVIAESQAIQNVTSDVMILSFPTTEEFLQATEVLQEALFGSTTVVRMVVIISMMERFCLSVMYFFLLSVAERTFKQRFLYAKLFCHLTSSRRARKSELPHFRLNKVRNIKTWLSVRSYLKKHGPQRSVNVIVSTSFITCVCVQSFLCFQILKDDDVCAENLYCWETMCWSMALGIFLMRFMILGSKINKKYRNLSVLITEQINLYLHMEQKPHKKDELMLANSVLKLAADLLKELESPFKISGLHANPYLYNITKVVVLSAFSAVLKELLGFKLKLHKIKIK